MIDKDRGTMEERFLKTHGFVPVASGPIYEFLPTSTRESRGRLGKPTLLQEVSLMRPVRVSVVVPRPPHVVFDFLDVAANHASFLDHMWTDFEFSGPDRGVGSRLRARSLTPGPEDWTEVEVIEVQAPRLIVERGSGAQGRRRTRGTYLLTERPDGTTEVAFELKFLEVPRAERLTAPLVRLYVRRLLSKAMQRLRAQFASGA
jgi:uncharacterized protein YndB with AHSA1/START domain